MVVESCVGENLALLLPKQCSISGRRVHNVDGGRRVGVECIESSVLDVACSRVVTTAAHSKILRSWVGITSANEGSPYVYSILRECQACERRLGRDRRLSMHCAHCLSDQTGMARRC